MWESINSTSLVSQHVLSIHKYMIADDWSTMYENMKGDTRVCEWDRRSQQLDDRENGRIKSGTKVL